MPTVIYTRSPNDQQASTRQSVRRLYGHKLSDDKLPGIGSAGGNQ